MRRWLTLSLLGAALLSACHRGAYITDDMGGDIGPHPLIDFSDVLTPQRDAVHSPYALGTFVTFAAHSNYLSVDESLWTVESRDESILRFDHASDNYVTFEAVGVGQTSVVVIDEDGEEQHSVEVEVREATDLELFASGPLLVGQGFDAARVDRATVLEGGQATFLVEYSDDLGRLSGHGILDAVHPEGSSALTIDVVEWRGHEVLQVSSESSLDAELDLRINGAAAAAFPVRFVPTSEIEALAVMAEDDSDARSDDPLGLWAHALDDQGAPIYGGLFAWDVDATHHADRGDLLVYHYDRGNERTVVATLGGQAAQAVTIEATDIGSVTSSNELSCSAAGAPRSGGAASLVLAAMLGLALRRRRATP